MSVPVCEVTLTVALSEYGEQRVCIVNENHIQKQKEYRDFIENLKKSSVFWHVKTIKTTVPMPFSYEEIK